MMTVTPPTKSVRVEEKAVLTMEVSDVTRVVKLPDPPFSNSLICR